MPMNPQVTFDHTDKNDVYAMVKILLKLEDELFGLQAAGAIERCQCTRLLRDRDERWPQVQALRKWVNDVTTT